MEEFDLITEINELKNQLAHARNLGFLLGAGTSCALKLPDIHQLTSLVQVKLHSKHKVVFETLKSEIEMRSSKGQGVEGSSAVNIEDVLNLARSIRDITEGKIDRAYLDVNGEVASELDKEICKAIYEVITEREEKADLSTTEKFFVWMDLLSRDFTKEVFTTNYDLIFEKALEAKKIPYFDGFVGAHEPFFFQESVENMDTRETPPTSWLRLWKLHGSLSWFFKGGRASDSNQIVRIGKVISTPDIFDRLVIYPSREKYDLSRRQPFLAYFDRFRDFLQRGELLFMISGFSFSDQHVNDVLLSGLRQNNRLFCVAFCYQDDEVKKLESILRSQLNFTVFGPSMAILNGRLGNWKVEDTGDIDTSLFWDQGTSRLKIGDFVKLVDFLIASSGKQARINEILN